MKSFVISYIDGEASLTAAYCDSGAALGKFLAKVINETVRARELFPSSSCSMVALMEEVGELAKACLEGKGEEIELEAIQVATMASRVCLEGDDSVKPGIGLKQ